MVARVICEPSRRLLWMMQVREHHVLRTPPFPYTLPEERSPPRKRRRISTHHTPRRTPRLRVARSEYPPSSPLYQPPKSVGVPRRAALSPSSGHGLFPAKEAFPRSPLAERYSSIPGRHPHPATPAAPSTFVDSLQVGSTASNLDKPAQVRFN